MNDSVSIPTGYGNVTRVSVSLIILTAFREDTGEYMCSASNEIGNDDGNVSIIVECKFIDAYKLLYFFKFRTNLQCTLM